MADYISHIILLPQGAEWEWYEAIRNYMLYFRVTVTQSADDAGSFHGTSHTITVVGDGPERAELERAYPEATFVGWQPPEAVRARMARARALLFPSVWYEGQPLTVLEAQAVGTPVLVSDICAGTEAVVAGVTGLHVACGSVSAWEDAVRRLVDDATADRMASAAYDTYWAAPLTLERHLDGLAQVYRAALADKAA